MNIFFKAIIIGVAAAGCSALSSCTSMPSGEESGESLSAYVEPRIGTAHCRWFHFAPGAMPFGLAKPGPSTNGHWGNPSGWEATGYDYRDTSIEGFPCLHEFQVGGIVLMPTAGDLITVPGDTTGGKGYRSHFDRADEIATPGYYSVLLKDYGIRAELTATPRVARSEELVIIIDPAQGEEGIAALVVKFKALVEAHGTLTEVDEWGKRRLAYPINDLNEGYYVLMTFNADPALPAEMDRVLRITDGIMRSMIVCKDEK